MNDQHTPGPWTITARTTPGGKPLSASIKSADGGYIAEVQWHGNAAIIAAVPEMLDALKYIDMTSRDYSSRLRARSALGHAGDTRTPDEAERESRLMQAAPAMLEALRLAEATIERLHPSTPFDSTQGTRDVIRAAIAAATREEVSA